MLNLDVLQNQWLILALFGGLAGALVIVLAYLAFWRVGGSPGGAAPEVPDGREGRARPRAVGPHPSLCRRRRVFRGVRRHEGPQAPDVVRSL